MITICFISNTLTIQTSCTICRLPFLVSKYSNWGSLVNIFDDLYNEDYFEDDNEDYFEDDNEDYFEDDNEDYFEDDYF